jgi:hypothetical protein
MGVAMSHLVADETAATEPRGGWLRLSSALTRCIADIAERKDLIVKCAPGAGRGAPGCFLPELATVELDGKHLGVKPRTCRPRRPSDRERYPALWGVLVHEAAHADHTRWKVLAGSAEVSAALLLEESRIEAGHLARRPGDRHWLRAATRTLILADAADPAMTVWDAAHVAGLVLARVDADVLDDGEADAVAVEVEKVLGDRLSKLRDIWLAAHATADDDGAGMLELGRRWCEVLGLDPKQDVPGRDPQPGRQSPLAEAVRAVLDAVATAGQPAAAIDPDRARERAAERDTRRRTDEIASRVFASTAVADPRRGMPSRRLREPTPAEQSAARRLARALRAAAHRERVTTTVTSPTPPGRLRMRDVLVADAQRAAGAVPTAEPFRRTLRRGVPAPPLRLGIACDVSRSMSMLAQPVASAAWILARAGAHVPDARSATVTFGESVHPVIRPGRAPALVSEFGAWDGTEEFCDAVDALDAALDLSRPGAARLLVVVSDGRFRADQRRGGQERVARLRRTGCAVLWLALQQDATPIEGALSITLTDPADAVVAIGQAAIRALAAT